jgi:Zn-dependent protease/predicted transcriptional regulator
MNAPVSGQTASGPVRPRGVFRLFRIFGFEVKLNPTWLLLALLITWTLAAGLFPADYPDLAPSTYWWMGLVGAAGILFSIVFHELTHSLVARRFGLRIKGITLFIFGGMAEMEAEPARPKVEFLMAVAGPLASLLLAGLFDQVERIAEAWSWPVAIVGVLHYLALLNLVLAIFNLVPAFPLDGGRMLRAALWHWMGNLLRATLIASRIGSGFAIVLMVFGVLAFIQGSFVAGMWWVLIGAFLRSAANSSYQQLLVREALRDKPVRELMSTDPVTVGSATTLERLLEDYVYRHHFKMLPVVDAGELKGCVTVRDIKQVPREKWSSATVADVLSPPSSQNTVSPDSPASRLLADMGRPGGTGSRLMVVDHGRLLGVISLRDLAEYVALKLELEPPRE